MKQRNSTMSRLAGILVLAVVCLWGGCGDSPTGPGTAKDYPVYFNSGTSMEDYYRFYPRSGRVDTFSVDHDSERALAVSVDGTRLYLASYGGVAVISADSLEYLADLPYEANPGGVALSPDGKLVAVAGDGLYVLRTSDYSVLFSDTVVVGHAVFSHDSRTLYCIGGYSSASPQPYIYRLVVADSTCTLTVLFPQWNGHPWRILPSIAGDRWFLILRRGQYDFVFAVYDVAGDSIVFEDYQSPGSGDLAQSKDGKFAFYSNPGTMFIGPPPPSSFTVFNVDENRIEKVVSTAELQSATPGYFPIGSLAVTPDGCYLVGLAGPGGGEFILFDLGKLEIEDNLLMTTTYLGEVVCQGAR